MSLSEDTLHEILARLPHDRAELLPALDEVNSRLGYLSRPAIESIARHLRLPVR